MQRTAQKILIENLKAIKHHKGTTQAQMGKANDTELRKDKVAQSTINRLIAGHHKPTLETLEIVSQATGIPVWQLLMPDLDPANLPSEALTANEQKFYDDIAQAFKKLQG